MLKWTHQLVGEGYNAEVGYVRGQDIKVFNPRWAIPSIPNRLKSIIRHGPEFRWEQLHSDGYGMTDQELTLRYTARFRNQSSVYLSANRVYVKLTDPYDPSNSDGLEYAAGEEFNYWYFFTYYRSDSRKPLSFQQGECLGGYFDGERYSLSGDLEYGSGPM